MVKCLPTMREAQVRSLGQEDPLKKAMATHSSTVAWKIPRTEERGRLQSMGSQRVGHVWATSLSLFTLFSTLHALGPVMGPVEPAPPHLTCIARRQGAMATVLSSGHRWPGKVVTTALRQPGLHTLVPTPSGGPSRGKTWTVELGQMRHSAREPQCWEAEEDGKALWGFPGWVSAEASRWLRLLVANQERCWGNQPLSNPTTIMPFCKVVAVLPAQLGHKGCAHLHSLVWRRAGWGFFSFLVSNKFNSALHLARQLLCFHYSSPLPFALNLRIKGIGVLVCTLRMQGGTWNTG